MDYGITRAVIWISKHQSKNVTCVHAIVNGKNRIKRLTNIQVGEVVDAWKRWDKETEKIRNTSVEGCAKG